MKADLTQDTGDAARVSGRQVLALAKPALGALLTEPLFVLAMSVRLVITDAMWDRIEPLMPADPLRGRRWADHRRTLEAIAWKYRTCSPWRDLPDKLGSFQTAHKRLIRRAMDGTWERILAAVLAAADADADIGWTASVAAARTGATVLVEKPVTVRVADLGRPGSADVTRDNRIAR